MSAASTTSTAARGTSPKLCPRCGAFYQELSSKTCPQCFAKLEILSDEDASVLIAEQESRARDPEYVAGRRTDDERFKEQSFGACLGVAAVVLATLVISGIFIASAAHRRSHSSAPIAIPRVSAVATAPLPSDFDQMVPRKLGALQRTAGEASLMLPGSLIRVYHGVYGGSGQVYAVADSEMTSDRIAAFELAAAFVAEQRVPPMTRLEFSASSMRYIVLGANPDDVSALANALRARR